MESVLRESLRGFVMFAALHPFVTLGGVFLAVSAWALLWRFLVLRVSRAALFDGRDERPGFSWWVL